MSRDIFKVGSSTEILLPKMKIYKKIISGFHITLNSRQKLLKYCMTELFLMIKIFPGPNIVKKTNYNLEKNLNKKSPTLLSNIVLLM